MTVDPVVIVGAGPAGMMLAYQLAGSGIPVRVLERHADFFREFRGEFAQPSVLETWHSVGLLSALAGQERVIPIRAVRMHLGAYPFAVSVGPDGSPAGQAVHQPSLLGTLHERCSRRPGYQLDFSSPVTDLILEGGRVRGVVVKRAAGEERISASLVVICNGRLSALRKPLGVGTLELEKPYKLLWLRFDLSERPDLWPDTLDGFVTRRSFYVLYPTYGRRVQLMWRRKRRYPLDWKAPTATLKAELLADAPAHWRPIFEAMNEDTERQALSVVCDRLERWWVPGALLLGDAAHTMSPIGGQGLTVAIRDAVVAANHLVDAHRAGTAFDDALPRIEAERRPEIEKLQAFQARAGRIVDAPGPAQWLMAHAVIPLATRLQGASYLRELQFGVTRVAMKFPPSEA
jgi:2-polyprenyl-6-methoxyphenol hydroxylase-like FAD-dependent oxidoreductase